MLARWCSNFLTMLMLASLLTWCKPQCECMNLFCSANSRRKLSCATFRPTCGLFSVCFWSKAHWFAGLPRHVHRTSCGDRESVGGLAGAALHLEPQRFVFTYKMTFQHPAITANASKRFTHWHILTVSMATGKTLDGRWDSGAAGEQKMFSCCGLMSEMLGRVVKMINRSIFIILCFQFFFCYWLKSCLKLLYTAKINLIYWHR